MSLDHKAESVERSRTSAIAVGGVGAILALVAFFVRPGSTTWLPRCPFYALTGAYCPICGSTRALHHLTHGEIATSLQSNALLVLSIPVLAVFWFRWLINDNKVSMQLSRRSLLVGAMTLLTFGILRNIPGFEFLAPDQ